MIRTIGIVFSFALQTQNNEASPTMFVVTSSAEEPSVRGRFIWYMKHVKGQFGYPLVNEGEDLRSFPTSIAFSKDGSIEKTSLIYYIENHLLQLYPDAEDVPGK